MIKAFYYSTVLVALVALGVSIWVVPKEKELALLRLKDKQYAYAIGMYEKQLAAEGMSLEIIAPLSELYLNEGRSTDAILILEAYLKGHPDEPLLEVRQSLGKLYMELMRPREYIKNLEKIYSFQPTPSLQREMLQWYEWRSNTVNRKRLLIELAAAKGIHREEVITLANLLGTHNEFQQGGDQLLEYFERFPKELDESALPVFVSINVAPSKIFFSGIRGKTSWHWHRPSAFSCGNY